MFWFSLRSVLTTLVHRQVERGDLFLRQLDVNLPAQAAVDGDGGHAVDALEPRRDLVLRDLAQRDRVVVALDADLHDRQLVRVELEDGRRVGVLGQPAAHAVHARAHFVGGFRQVRAPFEVELHLAVALGRRATRRASMPGTALTACSIGRVISSSISSGPTPG